MPTTPYALLRASTFRLVNQHHASILNQITDKGGPGWTILAIMVMRGWPLGFAGARLAVARAIGWF